MNTMASLKTFSPDEIIQVLEDCARQLHNAYQETLDADMRRTSSTAELARNFLLYVHHHHQNNHTIH
jgi:hypothetical protein